jgi:hypothetical protein
MRHAACIAHGAPGARLSLVYQVEDGRTVAPSSVESKEERDELAACTVATEPYWRRGCL